MHFILQVIKPVFSDNLSYVTIFQCSLGKLHKTDLTVFLYMYHPSIIKTREENNMGGIMVSVHVSSVVDYVFKSLSVQRKTVKLIFVASPQGKQY